MKILKTTLCILSTYLLFVPKVDGQVVYATADGILITLNINTCDTTQTQPTIDREIGLITWHPNGKLYGTGLGEEGKNLYEIDLTSGTTTLVAVLPSPTDLTSELTVGADGKLYTFNLDHHTSYDPVTGEVSNVQGAGNLAVGMTFFEGDVLYSNLFDGVFQADMENFLDHSLILPFNSFEEEAVMVGLFAFPATCDSSSLYGLVRNFNNDDFIYQIDLEQQSIELSCQIQDRTIQIGSIASPSEFIPPPCSLSIDLDADNSSGAEGFDYFADTSCLIQEAPIADIDLEIVLDNGQIDSMFIFFVDPVSFPNEVLTISSSDNLLVKGNNSADMQLNGTANTTLADYSNALLSIRLSSQANEVETGVRKIGVIAWAGEIQSDTAWACIPVFPLTPSAGEDADVSLCEFDNPVSLFDLLGNSAAEGGQWQPALASVEGVFDPQSQPAGTYFYVQTGVGDCPADTARVDVVVNTMPVFSLGADTSICSMQELLLRGELNDVSYLWSDGSSNASLSVSESGLYWLELTSIEGCSWRDTILVTLEDGDLIREEVHICEGDSYEFEGVSLLRDTTICQSFPTMDGCDSTWCLQLIVDPIPVVDAGPDQEIAPGDFTTISVSTDIVAPSNIEWTPTDYLDCSSCLEVEIRPTEDINYLIAVTDENGCVGVDEVQIRITAEREVFFPNVFTPNDDEINDYFTAFGAAGAFEITSLRIYNRWGAVVFERKGFSVGDLNGRWDGIYRGKPAPIGVYIYQAEIVWPDGRIETKTGDLSLIR